MRSRSEAGSKTLLFWSWSGLNLSCDQGTLGYLGCLNRWAWVSFAGSSSITCIFDPRVASSLQSLLPLPRILDCIPPQSVIQLSFDMIPRTLNRLLQFSKCPSGLIYSGSKLTSWPLWDSEWSRSCIARQYCLQTFLPWWNRLTKAIKFWGAQILRRSGMWRWDIWRQRSSLNRFPLPLQFLSAI